MRCRAFARADAVALIAFGVFAIALIGGVGGRGQPEGAFDQARETARQLKEAQHARAILQSLIIWGGNNRDEYPLPSKLDGDGQTVAEPGLGKNTSAAIYSLLIFNGFIPVEIMVSPAEVNPKIKPDDDYEVVSPKAARDPDGAMWDPAFSVDFTKGAGNASFAHAQPAAARRDRWGLTFAATDAMVALRGPRITGVDVGAGGVAAAVAKGDSQTFATRGAADSWSGNVAFNDNHVEFYENLFGPVPIPTAHFTTYQGEEGAAPDLWFYDEPDDWKLANQFVGIFPAAGREPAEFTPIWD